MKLPNDLIKSTDYDKAKERIIHEFECVNGKVVQHYVLGGEHELTTQEIIDCLNAFATIDCDLQTAYAYIKGQEDKIADLEAKLSESELKYNATNRAYWELVEKQDNDFLQYEKLIGENQQLKQQLAEKEDFIEDLMTGRLKPVIPRIKEIEKQYQDKISFAVEQLEQLRHDIWTNQADDGYTDMQVDLYDLNDMIDVRIMQIKERK